MTYAAKFSKRIKLNYFGSYTHVGCANVVMQLFFELGFLSKLCPVIVLCMCSITFCVSFEKKLNTTYVVSSSKFSLFCLVI